MARTTTNKLHNDVRGYDCRNECVSVFADTLSMMKQIWIMLRCPRSRTAELASPHVCRFIRQECTEEIRLTVD